MDSTHFCPGCAVEVATRARYPWAFCTDCVESAVDRNGRAIECTNVSLSGGFQWRFRDSPDDWQVCHGVIAAIRGGPALLTEAYMGSIVGQPLTRSNAGPSAENAIDLWS